MAETAATIRVRYPAFGRVLVGPSGYTPGSEVRPAARRSRWRTSAFIAPESQSQLMQVSILGARTAMEPAKPRKWTEEETKLLIELAQRKERVPAMAKELRRHIASVRTTSS